MRSRDADPIRSFARGKKVTELALEGLRKANIGEVEIEPSQFEGAYALADIVNTESGEVILEANNEITPAKLQEIVEGGIDSFSVFFPERDDIGAILSQTLKKDVITKPVDALARDLSQDASRRSADRADCLSLARRRCSSIRASLISRAWAV